MYWNYNVLFAGEKTATSTSSNSAIPGNSYSSKINSSRNVAYPWQNAAKSAPHVLMQTSRWQFVLVSLWDLLWCAQTFTWKEHFFIAVAVPILRLLIFSRNDVVNQYQLVIPILNLQKCRSARADPLYGCSKKLDLEIVCKAM